MDSTHLLTFMIGFAAGILARLMFQRNLLQIKGLITGITVTSPQPIQQIGGQYSIDGYVTIDTPGKQITKIWSKVYDAAPNPIPGEPPNGATDHGDPTTVNGNNNLQLDFNITETPLQGTTPPDDIVLWVEWTTYNNTSAQGA